MRHPVAITGIGIASSHGEGRAVHAALLGGAAPILDEARFAPHPVHPLAPLPFEAAIPRREMRQMETWQRLGVYAAGLAIDDAGLRDRVAWVLRQVATPLHHFERRGHDPPPDPLAEGHKTNSGGFQNLPSVHKRPARFWCPTRHWARA